MNIENELQNIQHEAPAPSSELCDFDRSISAARTVQDLTQLAIGRGYRSPESWAQRVFNHRHGVTDIPF
jgi:hypothetical protein